MKLATLLPASSAGHVQTTVGRKTVLRAHSWKELESLLATKPITAVFMDPAVDGACNTHTPLKLIRAHPTTPFVAYVPLSARNFAPVAKLSKYGLAGVILHPANDETLLNALEKISANSLVREFLGAFEASLATLSRPLVGAIQDLFERPHRYQFPTDVALEAGTTAGKVSRSLRSAKLGSAQKLMIGAKLLRAYSYLRDSKLSVEEVGWKLGYSDRRMLEAHTRAVFGCSPSRLRKAADTEEIIRLLLEWFYKPSQRHRVARLPSRLTRWKRLSADRRA